MLEKYQNLLKKLKKKKVEAKQYIIGTKKHLAR